MLRYLKYVFPAGNATDLALTQTVTAGNNLLLNGALAGATGSVDFLSKGYTRQVSLTVAVTDYSGVTFRITGIQNGIVVTEDLAGPHNNTVYSVEVYDTITSITVTGAVNVVGISAGTGWRGYFRIIELDLLRSPALYSLSIGTGATPNPVSIAVYSTLDTIVNSTSATNNIPFIRDNPKYDTCILSASVFAVKTASLAVSYSLQYPYTDLAHSTDAGAIAIPFLTKYLLVSLGASVASIGNSRTLIFTQL